MEYAIILTVKRPEALKIRKAVTSTGVRAEKGGLYPHISLAVIKSLKWDGIATAAESLAAETPPLKLKFSSIGIFPGTNNIVFLAPVVSKELLGMHGLLHGILRSRRLRSKSEYLPGEWVPHCTISREKGLGFLRILMRKRIFRPFHFDQIQIFRTLPSVKLISSFNLSGRE